MTDAAPAPARAPEAGIGFWMRRALQEAEKAARDWAPDPVHDLRVALRRCRSIADGFRAVDPHRAWRKMRKAGGVLFRSLGELRDCQVLMEWIEKLDPAGSLASRLLLDHCRLREQALKLQAAETLAKFDRRQWAEWADILERRTAALPTAGEIFRCLALEKLEAARGQHRVALHHRSKVAFHQLRIAIKRFRYIVENFLPEEHKAWGRDLKQLQDALGEVHDMDVLWATALQVKAFPDLETRRHWQQQVRAVRDQRLQVYWRMMVGQGSHWPVWRAALPSGHALQQAVEAKYRTWASLLDPDPAHTQRVEQLALQLYEGLERCKLLRPDPPLRALLQAAAAMHDVGRAKRQAGHHKRSMRLIAELDVPAGWTPEQWRMAALIARYHRGAWPDARQSPFSHLRKSRQRAIKLLAGILRLADALAAQARGAIGSLDLTRRDRLLVIAARGYRDAYPTAEKIAAARHLLEVTLDLPILIRAN